MSSTIVSPYKDVEQYTRISIKPHQINSDIRNNLKINLKKKVEKKCNKNGFVDEVYNIVEFEDGIMFPENLSGSVIYDVKYNCKLCLPIENTMLIARVKIINQELIIVENGPIFIFIPKDNIDTNMWYLSDNNFINKKTNKILNDNDFVLVEIVNKRINKDDSQIKAIGILRDNPKPSEILKYYGNVEDEDEEDNFII